MWRVAVRATDVVLEMGGSSEVAVLLAVGMTVKTTLADFLCRGVLKTKDLRFVASPVDVGLSWTVTCLAAMPLGPFLCIQSRDVVRRIFIALEETFGWHVFVAGFADFRAHVERWVRWPFVRFRLAYGGSFVPALLRPPRGDQEKGQQRCGKKRDRDGKVAMTRPKHSYPQLLRKQRPRHLASPQYPLDDLWDYVTPITTPRARCHRRLAGEPISSPQQNCSFKCLLGKPGNAKSLGDLARKRSVQECEVTRRQDHPDALPDKPDFQAVPHGCSAHRQFLALWSSGTRATAPAPSSIGERNFWKRSCLAFE